MGPEKTSRTGGAAEFVSGSESERMRGQAVFRRLAIAAVLVVACGAVLVGLALSQGWLAGARDQQRGMIFQAVPGPKEQLALDIAMAYQQDHNLDQASRDLQGLEVPDPKQWVAQLAQRYVTEGKDEAAIASLAELVYSLGVDAPQLAAYLPTPTATETPEPTATHTPTLTPTPSSTPTPSPVPPTDTSTPTDTPTDAPTATPTSTDRPAPTATRLPPTPTPKPKPTKTPKPTSPPAVAWTSGARLMSIGEQSQECNGGNLLIRVTVVDAGGAQIGGVWLYDMYSKQYQVTGNVPSADWGPGETKFEYGIGGGGKLCIAQGLGGPCVSDYSRDMPCYYTPPVEDLYAAGYCDQCCDIGISLEGCRQRIAERTCFESGAGHYSWHIVFRRSW